jgi:ketosteroid isomerase-like protein
MVGKTLMTETDRNVEFVRGLYERYAMGDAPDCALDSLADDVVWRSVGPPNRLPFARSQHGRDGVRAYFQALNQDWEMISYKINELIGQRDRVVALADVCFCHRRTGKLVATLKADVFRLRDGKIVEFCEFFDSAAAVEAATDTPDPPWPDSSLSGDADL